jgi:hypothetical protein
LGIQQESSSANRIELGSNASLMGTEKPDVAIRVNKINIAINPNEQSALDARDLSNTQ